MTWKKIATAEVLPQFDHKGEIDIPNVFPGDSRGKVGDWKNPS